MHDTIVKKRLQLIFLLAFCFFPHLTLADWTGKPSQTRYNQQFGDFPPDDIDQLIQNSLNKQDDSAPLATTPSPTTNTAAPVYGNNSNNIKQPHAHQPTAQDYSTPNYNNHAQANQYRNTPPAYHNANRTYPPRNNNSGFNGPWNGNNSGFSMPWMNNNDNNNGSGFSMPWGNSNGSNFSMPWGGNNTGGNNMGNNMNNYNMNRNNNNHR